MSERAKRNYIDENQCVWIEGDEMHIDAVKMCEALGVPPTRENQDAVEAAARDVAVKHGIPHRAIDDL